jgi:hypothetical protein
MFRSDEDGHIDVSEGEHMLFNSDTMHELSPDACPVCAIIEFKASTYQEELSNIIFRFAESEGIGRQCWLSFYTSGKFRDVHALQIIPADSKQAAIITYNN